jgi:subtilisin family serine protease
MWLPSAPNPTKASEGWELTQGTSFSTPQVTGACALLKSAVPGALPSEIKEALLRTVDPIVSGKSAQGVEMSEIDGPYGKIGMANINKAFVLLKEIQIDKMKKIGMKEFFSKPNNTLN